MMEAAEMGRERDAGKGGAALRECEPKARVWLGEEGCWPAVGKERVPNKWGT